MFNFYMNNVVGKAIINKYSFYNLKFTEKDSLRGRD